MVNGEDEHEEKEERNGEGGSQMNRWTCWSTESDRERARDNK